MQKRRELENWQPLPDPGRERDSLRRDPNVVVFDHNYSGIRGDQSALEEGKARDDEILRRRAFAQAIELKQ